MSAFDLVDFPSASGVQADLRELQPGRDSREVIHFGGTLTATLKYHNRLVSLSMNTFSIFITTNKSALAATPLSLSIRWRILARAQHMGLVVKKVSWIIESA